MANLKEVKNRISSVSSTQQITKAMKMVAAAKLRKAQDGILQMRPYAKKLNEILQNISGNAEEGTNNPYSIERNPEKILLVLVTSDKGLCGAFNTNIFRKTKVLIEGEYQSQFESGNLHFLAIGRKAADYLKRRKLPVNLDYVNLFQSLNFDNVRTAAEFVMKAFENGEYDKVEIIYNEFKNVATQIIRNEQFLPIKQDALEANEVTAVNDYLYEPSQDFIEQELIPKSLKIQFYKALLESNASEQGSRMTAMDKATDNAGELLKALKLTYNRTRQAAITKEILEIVGGAEALAAS
jgi:F-type H+-transporting ATPase subunit gamma